METKNNSLENEKYTHYFESIKDAEKRKCLYCEAELRSKDFKFCDTMCCNYYYDNFEEEMC